MLRLVVFIERSLRRINSVVGFFACVAMVAMVSLVFTNMALRYLFGVGSTWSQELEWYLMSIMAMLGIAYAMRYNDHVRVDIFSSRFSRYGRLWLDFLTALVIAIPCSLLIIYYGWPYAETSFIRGERSPTGSGLPWRFIPKGMIIVGFAFVAIEAVRQVLSKGRRLAFHHYQRA